MDQTLRETRLIRTLVRLADTLVADFDVLDLLQGLVEECVDLVGSSAAGILLADPHGRLEVAAASDESADVVEILQVAADDGPCVHCYRTGESVSVQDIEADAAWERFREPAMAQGFRSIHAVPLRLRKTTIGSMNLFRDRPGPWTTADAETAQALADMATIGILQSRAIDEANAVNAQLQHALESRVVIEQAKGFVAYRREVSLGEAFRLIREHARAHRLPLGDVARGVLARSIEL